MTAQTYQSWALTLVLSAVSRRLEKEQVVRSQHFFERPQLLPLTATPGQRRKGREIKGLQGDFKA